MIDFESQIYTDIVTKLRTELSSLNIKCKSITTYTPEEFPMVCIEEADNYANRYTRDTGSNENFADVMYEVNVYSNKANTAKSEAKQILGVIDAEFDKLGFTRTVKTMIPMNNAQICRMVARYQATIGTDGKIYRR